MNPRAIVVTPDLTRTAGGMRYSVPALWRAAARQGVGVEIHAPCNRHFPEDAPRDPDLPTTGHRIAGPTRFSWCPGMVHTLRRSLSRSPAVLSLHGLWMGTGLAVRRAAAATGAPLIVHPHGMLEAWAMARSTGRKQLAMRLFEGDNLRGAACLRALNREEAARFRELGLTAPIAVIPNPVELPPAETVRAAAETRAQGRRSLLFMSRLHPKKGLPELVRAWAEVAAPGWLLEVAGPDEGGHRALVESLVAELSLGDRVTFLGPLHGAEKARALTRASAFILPSHSEGFPVALLEAAAWGLPVVLTPGCHFPELAACHGAILAEPERDSLGRAIHSICGLSDAERASMGERARGLVSLTCDPAFVGAAMAAVVGWTLGMAERPPCVLP